MDRLVIRDTPLAGLAEARTCQEKLTRIHELLVKRCAGIDRVSVALFDGRVNTLRTFIATPAEMSPLQNYAATVDETSSLFEIGARRQVRIVNDLDVFNENGKEHSQAISGHGFASSYTSPVHFRNELAGFIFFNSMHKNYFRERVVDHVEIFAGLIAGMIMNDLAAMRALVAALRTAIGMVHMRDPETGNHLERMARYSQLIARELVSQGVSAMDDEQVELLFQFSPLHDIGKIGIPDHILQKPGRLDPAERDVMNTHTLLGREIVDDLIANFGFDRLPYIDSLRHITELHHEAMDGTGYPHGLTGDEIALEARIIAVSDIFDALTTARPYKDAWTNDQAVAMLRLLSIDKLDKDCVAALEDCREQVEAIQGQFSDEPV